MTACNVIHYNCISTITWFCYVMNDILFCLYFYRCSCGHCTQMPTTKETVCCRDVTQVNCIRQEEEGDIGCIVDHPGFDAVCLNEHVLRAAYNCYRFQYGRLFNNQK